MRTVAQVLIEARNKSRLSLDEVQRQTKIRRSILEALEKGDYDALPAPTFVKGLIRNYGEFLGLDVLELQALYRREFDERKNPTQVIPEYKERKFVFTPTHVIIGFVIILVLGFLGYLYQEYQAFAAPPLLTVEEPRDNTKINKNSLVVVGRTDPDAEIKINGQKINLGPGGTFAQEINVSIGTNALIITATNKLGKIATVSRNVTVELPKPILPISTSSAAPER